MPKFVRLAIKAAMISYCLSRFIRHQLIYAASLPPPGADAVAVGEKRYQQFLDTVAQLVARDTRRLAGHPGSNGAGALIAFLNIVARTSLATMAAA